MAPRQVYPSESSLSRRIVISTLAITALLIFAASLASYLLSIWPSFRNGRGVSFVLLGAGTVLLLAAVAIVVSTGSFPSLWVPNDELEPDDIKFLSPDFESHRSGTTDAQAGDDTHTADASPLRNGDRSKLAERIPTASQPETTSGSAITATPVKNPDRSGVIDPEQRSPSLTAMNNPWAATACVVALQLDPAEPNRWWLENECHSPVAILFASCETSTSVCNERESASWTYPSKTQVLPAKYQRSVTYAEQMQYGEQIRFVACAITAPSTIDRIAQVDALGSSRSGTDEPQINRTQDACLTSVEHWMTMGRQSGIAIDAMISDKLPGSIRRANALAPQNAN